MLTFLFWNLNNKPLTESVARLVAAHSVDVVLLAENGHPLASPATTLRALNASRGVEAVGDGAFRFSPGRCLRVQVFHRARLGALRIVQESDRYTIRRIRTAEGTELLLEVAHLLSRIQADEATLNEEVRKFADDIRRVEGEQGHERTVVAGDLNLDPFSWGVASTAGLHAVMTRHLARQGGRVVQRRQYPFFYNPMWSCLGERTDGPPGTYFYRRAEHLCYFWHAYDQVLVRPALLDHWRDEDLCVLTNDGAVHFLRESDGTPDKEVASDHLPILFRLHL